MTATCTRGAILVGDNCPPNHDFSVQFRPMDADKSGTVPGLPVLAALVRALLERNKRGGAVLVGTLNLWRHDRSAAESSRDRRAAVRPDGCDAVDAGCGTPAAERSAGQVRTKIGIEFYSDPAYAAWKCLAE